MSNSEVKNSHRPQLGELGDDFNSKWLRLRVVNRRIVARDVLSLDLVDPTGASLPAFAAGAHVDVVTSDGLIRQYSICNDPKERHRYRLGVLLEPTSRGGSKAIHAGFAEGETVKIGMPRNLFPIRNAAHPALLFGGGIGITPVLAMAWELEVAGSAYALHYCVRDPSRAAFIEEIQTAPLSAHSVVHYDDGPPEQQLNLPALFMQADRATDIYVCGPKGFIDFVLNGARRGGWSEDYLHSERFDGAASTDGDGFELIAERSGRRFLVPSGTSAADVLLAAGIDVPVSCVQGICGVCLTDVLEGIPDHRDLVQSDEAKSSNKQIALCCSRALTPVLRVDI